MSSTIFYRFLHQTKQSTIHFDGTGINVFDLKREIILQNQLGEGDDFILRLFHDNQSEFENDQEVIPRSSSVIAKRSPCSVMNGRSHNASRYVTGRPRITKHRANVSTSTALSKPQAPVDETLSEEDRIKRMFENQSTAWAQTQDELSTHKLVHYKPGTEDLPPPGYVCYRCGGKDHWMKNCPTLSDPNFEGKKIKKTTGIPKSYMKTISKETVEYRLQNGDGTNGMSTNDNGELVDTDGNTYTLTEEGDYVMTFADSKTWALYQDKQKSAANKQKTEYAMALLRAVNNEKRFEFIDPLSTDERVLSKPFYMTPCCQSRDKIDKLKNVYYNQSDLEELLIENDFHCPNCGKPNMYIDTLIHNEELEADFDKFSSSGLNGLSNLKRHLDHTDLPNKKRSTA